ncbi:hypothetical protein [Dictyobacter kobayashii]|uniref:Uncharacterized protein n=1 Tax=Dictyobacter kobayashii TaxID=2014872 RepID=A0A402AQW2_9CHLR|nr:hypothetical protein [Dictyobacter kobayashii]GCE21485.1 hypothetical protein KDK_52850 [Dictyobacter kobayashii]
MCRFGFTQYKDHYACFRCRKTFRYHQATTCPQCRRPLAAMGLNFRAPKQRAKEQWQVLEILYQHDINFSSCGCNGPGYRPTRMRDLPAFLAQAQASLTQNRPKG